MGFTCFPSLDLLNVSGFLFIRHGLPLAALNKRWFVRMSTACSAATAITPGTVAVVPVALRTVISRSRRFLMGLGFALVYLDRQSLP